MALTWPYAADPQIAAYVFAAAAAHAAAYGHQPVNYWNRSATPYQNSPFMVMRPTAPTAPLSQPQFIPSPVGLPRAMDPISNSNSCCSSNVCRGCNSPQNVMNSSMSLSRTTHSPETTSSKPLFQPYKNDIEK